MCLSFHCRELALDGGKKNLCREGNGDRKKLEGEDTRNLVEFMASVLFMSESPRDSAGGNTYLGCAEN